MNSLWMEVLTVCPDSQGLFIDRVLKLWEQAKSRKVSRAQGIRLDSEKWDFECDMACLFTYIVNHLKSKLSEEVQES